MLHAFNQLFKWYVEASKNLIIVYAILTVFAQSSLQFPALSRRSALEVGYVSFPEKPEVILKTTSTSSSVIPPTLETLKISTTTNVKKIENVQPLTVAVSSTIPPNHVRKEWIPGHVKDHAYIPAHARDVFLPAHPAVLSTMVVPTPTHKYQLYEDDRYRSHYGGFGVGIDYGGQGAGHGYQVAL